ncbi:MAG: ornithine carbamoyltransferase [Coriobacteriia bacterium]|nr:ornithine carbamoyltransferase [Coriobacteriia bacterium]
MHTLKGRDFLSLSDITPTELASVLKTAHEQKRSWAREETSTPLSGKAVALIFQKPSMRTRVSFELACTRLGAHPVVMSGTDGAFSRGETIHDTTKVLERYCEAIVIRTFAQSMVEEIAEVASVPVINALTDEHHPCQGLADLLTIDEHLGKLEGVRMAYVGDGNNMAHTYLLGGALAGMSVSIACPDGFQPLPDVVEQARSIAAETGATIELHTDPVAGVDGAQVVITDTWASMGQEDEHDARLGAFEPFRVDTALMAHAADGAIFMHCLPAHRGEEVVDEVIDAPYSVVFDEAENRLHAQKALLSLILG